MALYFFHLRDGADLVLDPDGRELNGIPSIADAALSEARAIIAADAQEGAINLNQRIEVENAGGEVIHRLEFEDAVEIKPRVV